MYRKVKALIPAFDIDMDGIAIKQALPTNNVNQVDPFLLLHHGKFTYTENASAMHQGIGPHPHRGFSPVTFVVEGEVHHRDSRGNNQIASQGEVQWMHAGAGIIHSERPSKALAESNGTQEIIQLWINSPANKKMQEPRYQFFAEADIPVFYSADRLMKNKLIAGNFNRLQSKIHTESEMIIIWSESLIGGNHSFHIPKEFNAMVYIIKGTIDIGGYGIVEEQSLVVFDNNSTNIEIQAKTPVEFLLLSGMRINEKVVQQGPYVMNTTTEIMEAMRDYRMGKMGLLIE